MNIRIQVLKGQAIREIDKVRGKLTEMAYASSAASAASGRGSTAMQRQLKSLTNFGNQLQWTGRQLSYNWTLPIAAATAAGVNFQMENERAMTRLKKVYADPGFEHTTAELTALEKAFEAMSERYGVAQSEVTQVAADWAAAGSSGIALARQTDLTMQTMILGEMEAAETTAALIAIQAQYNQNSAELTDTIARLNNVENQTGTTMNDLIVSMSRSAGVARASGIDVAHLAAMTAALVPAAGSASQAGNALKTIISRLLSPTSEAVQVLNEMGIKTSDMAWKSANASTRIQLLSDKYEGLSDSQKAVVSATLASRYQINKFEVLMDAIARKGDKAGEAMSYYWKALDAASNRAQYMKQVHDELNAVLDSNPRKWEIIKAVMMNSLANVVQPMLPALMALGGAIADVAKAISELPIPTQKWIGVGLLLLALIGPIAQRLGSLITLVGTLARFIRILLIPLMLLTRVFGLLWGVLSVGKLLISGLGLAFSGLMLIFSGMGLALPYIMKAWSGLMFGMVNASTGMFAAMRASWMIGLTGLVPMTLAAVAMLGAAIPLTFTGAISGAWGIVVAVWEVLMSSLAVITFSLGPTLTAAWTAVSVSLAVVMAQTGRGLQIVWASLMAGLEAILIGFATAAGVIWRAIPLTMAAGLRGPWSIILALTSALMVSMQTIFAAGWVAIQEIIVAGAALAGIIWRNAMVALATITFVGGKLIGAAMDMAGRIIAARAQLWTAVVWTWGNVVVPLMATIGRAMVAALASPWTWLVLAVVAVLYGLRDQIVKIWNSAIEWLSHAAEVVVDRVISAFNLLPQGIQNAILAVVRIIRQAALQVYEWFSYLNPFAHHSPSLVENVTAGMAAINRQFGTLSQIKGPIDSAYASIARLKQATGALANGMDSLQRNEDRKLLAEFAPGSLAAFDGLVRNLVVMKSRQDALAGSVKNQEAVVKVWQQRLDAANDALDDQRDILQTLQDVADGYSAQISKLNDEIGRLASTPLTGMGAMEDKLFANEMAQKRLRLEMLKMGEQGGQSYDQIRDKISKLAGEMETLTGERENLRSMGAGSEILDTYDAQIEALGKQKKGLEQAKAPVNELQNQLDELQRQAEILDLEKALKFDPLTRAIDKAANSMKEMPFDAIISKIHANQGAIDALTPRYDTATRAIEAQESAVTRAQAAVDAIQASYDAEAAKLEMIRDLYSEVADAVRDMEGALSDANGAASSAKQAQDSEGYVSPALQNFRDAEGGNFADVGGKGMLGREGGMDDQSAMIDQFTKDLAAQAGDMFGDFDMFGPIKDMWNKFVAWWNRVIGPWITATKDFFGNLFEGVDIFSGLRDKGDEVAGFFTDIWDAIVGVVTAVWDFGKILWDILGPEIMETLDIIFGYFKDWWTNTKTIWADVSEMWDPFVEAVKNFWKIIKVPLGLIFGYIVAGVQTAWSVFNGVLGPVLDWISGLFMNLWQVVKGLINVFIGLFTLDYKRFFGGLGDVLKGLWGIIWDTIVSLGAVILGAIKGLASGLFDGMVWIGKQIWEGLEAGLRAIGLGWLVDIFGAIIDWVKDLFGINSPSTVFAEIGGFLMDGLVYGVTTAIPAVWDFFVALPGKILGWIGDAGAWLYKKGKDVIGGLVRGLHDKGKDLAAWMVALPGKVMEWAGDTTTWLIDKGKDVIGGLLTGIEDKAEEVATWFTELPDKIKTWVGDAITFLYEDGFDLLTGFLDGLIDKVPDIIQWFQDLPGKIQDWIGDTVTYLIDNGKELITGFVKGIIDNAPAVAKGIGIILLVILAALVAVPVMLIVLGIALIVGFVKGIAEAISKWLGPKLEELKNFIAEKFRAIVDWVTKKWDDLWARLKSVLQGGVDWVSEKFTWLKDKVTGIFTTIRDTVGKIWDGLLEKVKTPIRVVFTFVNDNMIKPINTLLGNFPGDLHINDLPHLATGGPVRGPGTGTSDSILGVNRRGVPTSLVSNGEYVVNEKSTRANFGLIAAINNAKGKLPGFSGGGPLGFVGDIGRGIGDGASWAWDKASDGAQWVGDKVGDLVAKGGRFAAEHILKPLRDLAKGLVPGDGIFPTILRGTVDKLYNAVVGKGDEHDKQQASLQGGSFARGGSRTPNGIGGLGPAALAARNFVMRTFGVNNIGGYANRNIAGTGTLSDHATGHAIDVMIPDYKSAKGIALGNKIASYFVQNPNAFGTKYVIWRDQINTGGGWRAYRHPGGGSSDTLQHRDHDHISLYDKGGIMSGLGVNMSGKPERVLSPRQTVAFERLVASIDSNGVPSMARLEAAIFRASAKANAAATIGQQTIIQHQGDNNVTVNIYGDLSFPNISDGNDADVFIQNLGDIVGGSRR